MFVFKRFERLTFTSLTFWNLKLKIQIPKQIYQFFEKEVAKKLTLEAIF